MRRILLVLAVVVFIAVGCGDDDNDNDASGTDVTLAGTVNEKRTKALSGDELELEADNFYFDPTYITATSDAGKIKIDITNEGAAPHTFTSDELGVDQEVQPGEKQEVEVDLTEAGTFEFYCRFHKAGGMRGAIVVS